MLNISQARRLLGGGALTLALAICTVPSAQAEQSIEASAIAAIAGPIAEEIAERFPRVLPAIHGAIQKRKEKKKSKITQIIVEPYHKNAAQLHTTIACGMHINSKKGRMRFRRLNVWVNNRIVLENDVQSKHGAQRSLTYAVMLRDFLDVEQLTEAVRGDAKEMTIVVRVEAKCETFNEKVANFNGWKSHKTSREIFIKVPINLTDPERCKILDTCKTLMTPKIEVTSFRSKKRRYVGSCPAKVVFQAKVKATGPLAGKAWLEHDDGSKSKQSSWSMARAGSTASNVTRVVAANDAGRRWSKLVLRYKDANGNTKTVKSRPAAYGVVCRHGLKSG